MHHLTLGTAGHIDHGKSSLIRALTGTDPDRLPEEKARGITIDLGFAVLEGPECTLHIIDVPGHERFIKNMAAGAGTIDLMLLVVAADEGIMPQTREHLAICTLLGVKGGLVALTKCDLVTGEWRDMVAEEVREFCLGTPCAGAPISFVSAVTGEGLPTLTTALFTLAGRVQAKRRDVPFRLPVDRVFPVKGFGTVVTGTVTAGVAHLGETLKLFPGGNQVKIRGLQVHGKMVEEAVGGQRAALNLAGVHHSEVGRGDWIADAVAFQETSCLTVHLKLLPEASRPLRHRERVRLHHGTGEFLAKVSFPSSQPLAPGGDAWAQLTLERPILASGGDRLLLRRFSPLETLGGGTVVDSEAIPWKGAKKPVAQQLERMFPFRQQLSLAALIEGARLRPLTPGEIARRLGCWGSELEAFLKALQDTSLITPIPGTGGYVAQTTLEELATRLLGEMKAVAKAQPLIEWWSLRELPSARHILPPVVDEAAAFLEKKRVIVLRERLAALPEVVSPERTEVDVWRQRLAEWAQGVPLRPVEPGSAAECLGLSEAKAHQCCQLLEKRGYLRKIAQGFWLLEEQWQALVKWLRDQNTGVTVSDVRQAFGTTRKYMVPLMEYCDRQKITRREGDVRYWRE